jgi:hypothetical protein
MSIASLIEFATDAAAEREAERPPSLADIRRASDPDEAYRLKLKRGEANERRLLRVLRSGPTRIGLIGLRRVSPTEDRKGADLVAAFDDGVRVWIQVKSSEAGAARFMRRGWEKGVPAGRFAVIVVREGEADELLRERALAEIGRAAEARRRDLSSHR